MSIALPPTISSSPPPTKHPTAATPLQPLPPPSSSSPSRQSQGFDAVLNPSASSRRLAEGVAPANAPAVPPTIVVPSPISPPPRPPPSLPPPPQTQRSSLAPSPHVYIAAPAPSFWPPPAGSSSSSSTGLAVGLSVGLSVVLLLLGVLYYFYHKRKGRQDRGTQRPPNSSPGSEHPSTPQQLTIQAGFSYEELAVATNFFSDADFLGEGGFGCVYKGILRNGQEVAVKQLKPDSRQGDHEFQAEVQIISRLHHKHLVSLKGCCISGAKRLLVFEYVPNNTLEFHLHGRGQPPMDWPTRLRVALGSAKGLTYLHEDCQPKIIHRDIKAANILLDHNFEAKVVADFGLAKFFLDTKTHISTRVIGTFGYLAPEYASTGRLTDKSDVFSFGVLLLELITGRPPIFLIRSIEESLVDWARPLLTQALNDGEYDAFVDPRLRKKYAHNEMGRMVACAAVCVRHSARRRPRMSQIVRALEGLVSIEDLSEGATPGHSTLSSYGQQHYMDMRRPKNTLTSHYNADSEYSATTTSEYDMYSSGTASEGREKGSST
ncbi:unnamed protein product [Musa hybrid cultivar]